MMTVLGIVIFFVGILASVAWHELGHFSTARWFGIKAPEFMVGFGRTIWSRKVGETEFGLKAIPLGGYVRMIGMIPPAKGETLGSSRRTGPFQGMIDDVRQQSAQDVRPEDAHRQFYLRAPWKRIIVMFAGPFMNLILAVGLFAVVLMGFGVAQSTTTVGLVTDCVVPATAETASCPPDAPPTPALQAGFQQGDRIVAVNGRSFGPEEVEELRRGIRQAEGTVTVTVERDGDLIDLHPTLTTNLLRSLDDPEEYSKGSFLGIGFEQEIQQLGAGEVAERIGGIITRTGEAVLALPSKVPDLFGAAFFGEERGTDSPVGIVGASRLGGQVLAEDIPASQTIAFFLQLLAAVNISLCLINLLPIPPLDGGQIFPAVWESVNKRVARLRGRPDPGPVDVAKLMPVAYVAALIIIAWSGLVFIADIVNPVRIFQ